MVRLAAATLALATLALGGIGTARACAIDGKPSAFANGGRAIIFKGAPTPSTYAWWARFAFPHAFRSGQRIAFKEDDAQVRKVLPLYDKKKPWRWLFGDGAAVDGDRASHVYRRPGHYKISVDAYFKNYGWQPFDTITIVIDK